MNQEQVAETDGLIHYLFAAAGVPAALTVHATVMVSILSTATRKQ